MKFAAGSLAWLVAHDLTLNGRRFMDMFGRLPAAAIAAICVGGAIALHLVAWPLVLWLLTLQQAADALSPAAGAAAVVSLLAWMAAQGLLGMSRTLQERGGMDLLLASPLPARPILAARLLSIAAGSFASVGFLVLPLANMAAILDGPAWLAAYPSLAALALLGTIAGAAIAVGLFLRFDARRARFTAQMCAAFIGGAFLLALQIAAMLPATTRTSIGAWWAGCALVDMLGPIVAGTGGALPSLLGVTLFAMATFAATVGALSPSFLRANLRAAGGAETHSHATAHRTLRLASGLRQTLQRKEWRLLFRDPGVFAQISLQIIYTVPLAVVLLRGIDNMPLAAALAPTFVVIAAQLAASLAWITVSGEDAPELIAAAPVRRAEVELAKLSAIGLPVLLILALPLVALAVLFPYVAILAALFATVAGVSTAFLNLWHPMPGNRRGMLRRHSQSKLMALLEHLLALLWAVATVLALIGSAWVLLPVALVALVLFCCRPTLPHSATPAANTERCVAQY